MKTRARVLALATGGLLLAVCAHAAKEKRIVLRFTPKENVTANLPALGQATPAKAVEVMPLTDARALPDLSLIGENREHKTPRPVKATTPVADFATMVLTKCLLEWGVRLGKGGLVLRGEITNLFVTEDQTYSTAVAIRFRLEDGDGKLVWEGMATGDAHQWGRSFKEENYVEQISDALKKTYANLVSASAFQEAWAGRAPAAGAPTLTAAELKAKVLEMMKAGVGVEVIVGYVKGVKLSKPLDADQIVEWKKAGIPEAVLNAAVSR